jgi:thiol-disulfide isomerase/thioredoxin
MGRGNREIARLLGILLLSSVAAAAADDAPRFYARTMEGEKLSNDTLKGKVVLLQFWTTWCRYCRNEQSTVDSLGEELSKKGLVVVAVNVGQSRKTVSRYLKDSPRSSKVVLNDDTNLPALYQARQYPLYVVIDRDGKVAGRQDGAAGEEALRELLARAGVEKD